MYNDAGEFAGDSFVSTVYRTQPKKARIAMQYKYNNIAVLYCIIFKGLILQRGPTILKVHSFIISYFLPLYKTLGDEMRVYSM